MAYALVSTAVEKLNTILQDEVSLLVGVTDEIENLSSTFTLIQAVLEDAEHRQYRREHDKAVKIWLEKVKDVAYDVDDILDEWMTEVLKSQATDEGDGSYFSKKKVRSFFSPVTSFNHVVLRHKIGRRIKEARTRLAYIAEERNQLGLIVDNGVREGVDSEARQAQIKERETGSLLDRPGIVGREDDKNKVIDLLLRESSGGVNEVPVVISIVGMGGLSKTTLAQLAYNDEDVKGHFNMRIWVCVSEDFDVKRITKSIIESATGSGCESLDLAPLQDRLHGMLQAKRFLLVLDDVWSNDSEKWDNLRLPFQAGAPGSRIIVTTRIEDVASMMGSNHMHKLAVLSDDDCWLLFSRRALEHRHVEERSELEEIGKEIVKKCGGVPLAAKTIGSAMRLRSTRRQWELVLGSEIWNSGELLRGILPALLLSYCDLPPALKKCFTYCSVFPKDWMIQKEMMVRLWVAQGFIPSNGSTDIEEIGGLYFDNLLRRSLLQDAELDYDNKLKYCKMHDLVHDLAQSVAGSDYSPVVIGKQTLLSLNNVRHSFVTVSDEAGEVISIPATLYKAHKLRTLLGYSQRYGRYLKVPQNLFHHLRCLRALDLSQTSIKELPQTVGQLKHLRYLDLSRTDIEELPEGMGNCRNLQTLRLNHCHKLTKLPRGIRKMISLRHLEFGDCPNLIRYLPQGIGRLTDLRTLTNFNVGGGNKGCKCSELKHLNHLQGSLRIAGLENIRSRDEAREAELYKKQQLHWLTLVYTSAGEALDDEVKRMDDVLQTLQPHTNLKEFNIYYYYGSKLPKWIEDPVFSSLVSVVMRFCKCKQLPVLGKLPSLKYLYIFRMEEVRKVGGEFSGDDDNDGSGGVVVSFPKLETLNFAYLKNWEEWELRDGEVMPSLLELSLQGCIKLKALPCNLPPLLRKLTLSISNDGMLSGMPFPILPNLNDLEICCNDELTSLHGGWLGQLKALQTLKICRLRQLGPLPEELQHLTMLQRLDISYCPVLGSLPEWLGNLTMLQRLDIRYCRGLGSLPEGLGNLTMLQKLNISTGLGSLPEGLQHLTMLQELNISGCPGLGYLPKGLGHLTLLQRLTISSCPRLGSLPEELRHLTMLQIRDCPGLGYLPEGLQHLTMLQDLIIAGCPVLEERYRVGGEDRGKIAHIPRIRISTTISTVIIH